jgi:hypothetical protein
VPVLFYIRYEAVRRELAMEVQGEVREFSSMGLLF